MSEKRYFKIFSERHTIGEQNKYIALFDELDRAEEEVDKELKQEVTEIYEALGMDIPTAIRMILPAVCGPGGIG